MLQDLAAIAPPFIVCVAFLVGVGALLRREMAPKRRRASAMVQEDAAREVARPDGGGPDGRSGLAAAQGAAEGHGPVPGVAGGEESTRELGGTSGS